MPRLQERSCGPISTASSPGTETIFDKLIARGISVKYYWDGGVTGNPLSDDFSLINGHPRYESIIHTHSDFLTDANSARTLPAVSYVDSFRFHPSNDISVDDDTYLRPTVNAILQSPDQNVRDHTVVVVTFDEGGGFFDHATLPHVTSVSPFIDNYMANAQPPGAQPRCFRASNTAPA